MRITYPLYEGDGYLHYRAAPVKSTADKTIDVRAIEQRAKALRREVLASLLARFGNWLETKLQSVRGRETYEYLSRATDHADLERRLREVERKGKLGYC